MEEICCIPYNILFYCFSVYSGIEYGGCVMDCNQLSSVNNNGPDQSDHSESESGSEHGKLTLNIVKSKRLLLLLLLLL